MINTHFQTDEIDTTFEKTSDEPEFVATHAVETPQGRQISVEREYQIDRDSGSLHVFTTYSVEGSEVEYQEQEWDLSDSGQRVEYSGEEIETFCQSNHNADPQVDMNIALKEAN